MQRESLSRSDKKIQQQNLNLANYQKIKVRNERLLQQIFQQINQNPSASLANTKTTDKQTIKQLKSQNIILIEQNRTLRQALEQAKINTSNNDISQILPKQIEQKGNDSSFNDSSRRQNHLNKNSSFISTDQQSIHKILNNTGCKDEKNLLQLTNKMHQHARLVVKRDQQNIQELKKFLTIFVRKLVQTNELQNISVLVSGESSNQRSDMILVKRKTYETFFHSYLERVVDKYQESVINNKTQQKDHIQKATKQKVSNQNQESKQEDIQLEIKQFQNVFQRIAIKAGFQKQWINYKQKNKDQSIKFRHQINDIVGQNSQQNNQKQNKQAQNKQAQKQEQMKNNLSDFKTSAELYIRQYDPINIQNKFIHKLGKLILKVGFSTNQLKVWQNYQAKLKSGSFIDIKNIISNIQGTKGINAISNYFSICLIRCLNTLSMRLLKVLEGSKNKNPYPTNQEMLKAIQKNSKQVKSKLQLLFQKQFNLLIENPQIQEGMTKSTSRQNKQIEKQLTDTLKFYQDLFEKNLYFIRRNPPNYKII